MHHDIMKYFGSSLLLALISSTRCLSGADPHELSPDIAALVEQGKEGKCVCYSLRLSDRPFEASSVAEATRYVAAHKDSSSYHLLYALHRYYPDSYALISNADKAAVLCSALENVEAANDWSILTSKESGDREVGQMLIAAGRDALPALKKVLTDDRRVRNFGSTESTVSVTYDYRRKDFAYRYVCMILGRNHTFDATPEMRDKRIRQLLDRWEKGTLEEDEPGVAHYVLWTGGIALMGLGVCVIILPGMLSFRHSRNHEATRQRTWRGRLLMRAFGVVLLGTGACMLYAS